MDELIQLSLPEMRVFVLDIPEKTSHEVLSGQIRLAGTAGFNGILIPFFKDGYSLYPSLAAREQKFPAVRPDLKKNPDLFYEIFESAFLSHLRVWAYIDPLSLGNKNVSPYGSFYKKRKKWISMNKMRKPFPIGLSQKDAFLCVYNEDVRRFVADLTVEIVGLFPVNGLLMDLSCYPHYSDVSENVACFCDSCRKQVKEDLSLELQQILQDPADSAFRCWKRWKNERLFSFVEYLSGRIGNVRSGIPFLTLVPGEFENLHESGVENRGEPGIWASEGLVSSLVTRYHAESPGRFVDKVKKDLSYVVDDILLTPSIRVDNVAEISSYIEPLRAFPLCGYICSLSAPLTDRDSETLSHGLFSSSSLDSLSDLFASLKCLIKFILNSSKRHSALNSFLLDIHSYIENEENITPEKTQSILDDLQTIEQKFKSGDLDTGFLPSRTLRDISLIKKLLRTTIIFSR
jgi:hypothetical protein